MLQSRRPLGLALVLALVATLIGLLPVPTSGLIPGLVGPAEAHHVESGVLAPEALPLPECKPEDIDRPYRIGCGHDRDLVGMTYAGELTKDGSVTVTVTPRVPECGDWDDALGRYPNEPCFTGTIRWYDPADAAGGCGFIGVSVVTIGCWNLRDADGDTIPANHLLFDGGGTSLKEGRRCRDQRSCTITWDANEPGFLSSKLLRSVQARLTIAGAPHHQSGFAQHWIPVRGTLAIPFPKVDFTYEDVGGLTFDFTEQASHALGLPLTYNWNFGDGWVEERNPRHTFPAPGEYTVRLSVTDGHGHFPSTSKLVVVEGPSATLDVTLTKVSDGPAEVGEPFDVLVEVAAAGANSKDVVGIAPTTLLELPDWLELVEGSFPGGFDLAPGESRGETLTLQASDTGEGTITSTWEGLAGTQTVTGTGELDVTAVGTLTGEWFRTDLRAPWVREGETTDVRLRVENETRQELTDVTLEDVTATLAQAAGEGAEPGPVEGVATSGDEGDTVACPQPVPPSGEDEPARVATLTLEPGATLPSTLAGTGPPSVGFVDAELTGVTPGEVVLCAHVTGRTADGTLVAETVETDWEVKEQGLDVDIDIDLRRPDGSAWELNTDNDGDGDVDEDDHRFDVTVTVTNTTDDDVTDLHFLDESEPVDWSNNLVGEDQGAPKLTLLGVRGDPVDGPDGPQPGAIEGLDTRIPDLATSGDPGDSHTVTFVYEATGEIDATGQSVVLGAQGNATVRGSGKADLVFVSGILLEFSTWLEEPDRLTTSGQVVRIGGYLENLDEDEQDEAGNVTQQARSIAVWITPLADGNASGGHLVTREGGRTPLGAEFIEVAPGERVDLHGILATLAAPRQTFAEVRYLIDAWQVPKVAGDTALPLAAERIDVVVDEEREWGDEHSKRLRFADLDPDDIKECQSRLYVQIASCNFVLGLQSLYFNSLDAAKMAKQGVGDIGSSTYWVGNWAIHEFSDAIKVLQGDRAAIERLAIEMEVQAETWKALGIMSVDNGVSAVGVLDAFLAETDRVLDEGDTEAGLAWISKFAGENPDLLFSAFLKARTLAAVGQATLREGTESAAGAIVREAVEAEARTAQTAIGRNVDEALGKALDPKLPSSGALRSGLDVTDVPKVWRDLYGAARADMQKMLQIAREEDILIAFRSRSRLSIKLLEEGRAWLKPQSVKAKNVNAIDVAYLGFPQNSLGTVAMLEPPVNFRLSGKALDDALDAHMAKLKTRHPELADEVWAKEVRARLEMRTKKFEEHLSEWLDYAANGMPVGFDGAANSVTTGHLNVTEFRATQIEVVKVPDPYNPGETLSRINLKVAGPDGTDFRPLTGDIDVVGFFNLDRSPIMGAAKRDRIYQKMRAAGMQHGETLTWDHKKRAELLREHIGDDAELLVVASPDDRVYLSALDEQRSSGVLDGDNFKDTFSLLDGPPVELDSPVRPPGPPPSGLLDRRLTVEEAHQAVQQFKKPADIIDQLKKIADQSGGRIVVDDEQSKGGPAVVVLPDGTMVIYRVPKDPLREINASSVRAAATGVAPAPLIAAAVDPAPTFPLSGQAAVDWVTDVLDGYRHTYPRPAVGRLGGVWEEITFAAAAAEGEPGRIELPLTTWTDMPIRPGATELSVLEAGDLGVPGGEWFAPGDQVVLDPGGAYEQLLTLTSVDGHRLSVAASDALLPDEHQALEVPEGVQVLYVPAGAFDVEPAPDPPGGGGSSGPSGGHGEGEGTAGDTDADGGEEASGPTRAPVSEVDDEGEGPSGSTRAPVSSGAARDGDATEDGDGTVATDLGGNGDAADGSSGPGEGQDETEDTGDALATPSDAPATSRRLWWIALLLLLVTVAATALVRRRSGRAPR